MRHAYAFEEYKRKRDIEIILVYEIKKNIGGFEMWL